MEANKEAQSEEDRFLANDGLQDWWRSIVFDPRFKYITRAVNRRNPYREGIKPTSHGQHVSDGQRQGFSKYEEILEGLAFKVESPEVGDILTETQNPELDNGTEDEAERRFG